MLSQHRYDHLTTAAHHNFAMRRSLRVTIGPNFNNKILIQEIRVNDADATFVCHCKLLLICYFEKRIKTWTHYEYYEIVAYLVPRFKSLTWIHVRGVKRLQCDSPNLPQNYPTEGIGVNHLRKRGTPLLTDYEYSQEEM